MKGIQSISSFCVVLVVHFVLVKSTPRVPTSFSKDGDVVIAGLFPLHYQAVRTDNYSLLSPPAPAECIRFNYLGFQWMQAMIFAIDEINNKSNFLPDIKLGYQIFDTCNTHSRSVNQAIYISEKVQENPDNNISAVIGPTGSAKSTVTSNIFSLYDIPQISYGSTSRILSDKTIYSSFFRTIPNDDEQTRAILDLLLYHNWTWVGAIAGDDDYGRPGISKLKQMAVDNNICIEYTGYVSQSMKVEDLQRIAKEVQDFNATVFVLFISASNLQKFAKELSALKVYDKVWIASEAWATSDLIRQVDARLFEGTLGIAERGGPMPNFREFLEGVSPISQPNNPFLLEFWQRSFNCTCYDCFRFGEINYFRNNLRPESCSLTGNLSSSDTGAYLDWTGTELEKSYNVYLAVHAIAYSLENIKSCENNTNGLLQDGKCPTVESLKPWQLLAYLREVNFTQPSQNLPFHFDKNGDPQASYKIVNWQFRAETSGQDTPDIEFVDAGYFSAMMSPTWNISDEKLHWRNRSEVPLSICTGTCRPGTYQVRLSSQCCFECRDCPVNQISTEHNSEMCTSCSFEERSAPNGTTCIPKLREYVRWNDAFGITFASLVVLGVSLTLFCAGVFFKHRNSPMVKATNIEISFLLFVSITSCFLTPLFYITEPTEWSCQARMVTFSLSFTLSIAAVLVKTVRVLAAFKARVPVRLNKRSKWLGQHLQVLVVLFITLLQVGLCLAWLLVEHPTVILSLSLASNDTLLVECSNGSVVLMVCVYVYLSALAIAAFVFAFRARKLPENFNEAKFITFSMLIFFIVWCSFIPAYLTTRGSTNTAVYCIAIFAATFGILSCIFFPKLYVILITPERNTKLEVRASTANHAIKATRRSTRKSMPRDESVQDQLQAMSFDLMKGFNVNQNNNNNKRSKVLDNTRKHVYEKNSSSEFNDSASIISTITMQISTVDEDSSSDLDMNKEQSSPKHVGDDDRRCSAADAMKNINQKRVSFDNYALQL